MPATSRTPHLRQHRATRADGAQPRARSRRRRPVVLALLLAMLAIGGTSAEASATTPEDGAIYVLGPDHSVSVPYSGAVGCAPVPDGTPGISYRLTDGSPVGGCTQFSGTVAYTGVATFTTLGPHQVGWCQTIDDDFPYPVPRGTMCFGPTICVVAHAGDSCSPANAQPTVDAGADFTVAGPHQEVSLAGAATDDGLPNPPAGLSIEWTAVSGPGVATFSDATSPGSGVTFSLAGEYVLELRAFDGELSTTDRVTVTVAPDRPPVVDAGNDQSRPWRDAGRFGRGSARAISVAGSVTDDGPASNLRTRWEKASGPGMVVLDDPAALNSIARFSEAGSYVLRLTASDGEHTAADTVRVVAAAPQLNWRPLLDAAARHYLHNERTRARGYFEQILNLVCAASRSPNPTCATMRLEYPRARLGRDIAWAQEWPYEVFVRFLLPYHPSTALDQLGTDAGAVVLCRALRNKIPILVIKDEDCGAVIVGALHFIQELRPQFELVTRRQLEDVRALLGPHASAGSVAGAALIRVGRIRAQHAGLFKWGVAPGFRKVAESGGVSRLGSAIATAIVPWGAESLREPAIRKSLSAMFGEPLGNTLYSCSLRPSCVAELTK